MNLKELKYVIYGDDKLSGKLKGITAASDKTTIALGRHSNKLNSLRDNFKNLSNEIPGAGNALAMISSPMAMTAAGAAALAYGLNKAVGAASEFNSNFRQLANINLDKTKDQLNSLKNTVLNLSSANGFDPNKTSTAYFDVQSLTGKYGKDVEQFITKVGKFSQVMQSDFNETITGAAKASVNFGFGLDKMDQYLASSQKTVAVAKVSYDELSRVQTEYSGSAKSAFQSFESANKLFSLFTVKAKSAQEAATLTKSAFTDLFKKQTTDAFKKIGMSLFDKKGLPKQVDQIITELNTKFMAANKKGGARAMNALKNEFSGSEGINSLLAVAMDTSGRTLQTLQSYNGAMTDFQKATKGANNDLTLQKEIVENKLKVAWINLGNQITPQYLAAIKFLGGVINFLATPVYFGPRAHVGPKFESSSMSGEDQNKYLKEYYQKSYDAAREEYGKTKSVLMARRMDFISKQLKGMEPSKPGVPPKDPGGLPPGGDLTNSLNGVAGGGSQVKNVSVVIQKMVEKLEVHAGSTKESASEIKRIVEETLIRAINGAEQVVGG